MRVQDGVKTGDAGIAFVCGSAAQGGAELTAYRLAEWMAARGWAVTMFANSSSALWERPSAAGIDVVDMRGRVSIVRDLRARDIRFLFVNSPSDLRFVLRTTILGGAPPAIALLQHMQLGSPKRDILHRWMFSRLSWWITPLPWLATQASELAGIPIRKLAVIPYGITLKRFVEELPDRAAARLALGLPQNAFIAGMVGRLDRGKGQEYLVRAIALLCQAGIDAHALIMGDNTAGEMQRYDLVLASLARELGIANRVHMRPASDKVEVAYAAMDVFTLTSISETYGLVTIEAMASARPVIGSRSAGTPEVLTDKVTGILVPPADAGALAEALRGLAGEPGIAAGLARAAREDAIRRFSHETQCTALETLITRTIHLQ